MQKPKNSGKQHYGGSNTLYRKIYITNTVSMIQIGKNFQHNIMTIFLSISFNICFGCSKEPSDQDGSFEYPQHMFWFRNKKKKICQNGKILGNSIMVGVTHCIDKVSNIVS